MNNSNTLTIAKPLRDVNGMSLIRSEKTGNTKITLMSKRDFVKGWLANKANADKPKKQAQRDFDAYRSATLKDFNARLSVEIANGSIVAERINADKTGDLRTIALVRRDRKALDQAREALRRTSELTGIPVEELEKRAKALHSMPEADVEVAATEAQSAQPATENQTNAQPQEVAAGQ